MWEARQTAFGETTVTTQLIENNLRFPGQYYDHETQTHYNYFRDYEPNIGRYLQRDPIGLNGGINTYGYVKVSPLKGIDPYGLFSSMGIPGGSFGVGGATTGTAQDGHRQAGAVNEVTLHGGHGGVCGAEGTRLATWIKDGEYEEACRKHDQCYADCSKSKDECDREFLVDGAPYRYYMAVNIFGENAYNEARKNCDNCKK